MGSTYKYFWRFLAAYILIRVVSFYFGPPTPLQTGTLLNNLLAVLTIGLAAFWLWQRDIRGWYIVLFELVLGGAGGLVALSGIALRTWLLLVSLLIYFGQKIYDKKLIVLFKQNKLFCGALLFLYSAVSIATLRGWLNIHALGNIVADVIPYLFLLYYFPAKELLPNTELRKILLAALLAAVFGNALFILFTFVGFSSQMLVLQDTYYHWYRDVALGKITELPFHFYRLVLNEHLLLVPVLLYYLHKLYIRTAKFWDYAASGALIFILATNLTRIYLLALFLGILIFFTRQNWARWLTVLISVPVIFLIVFTALHWAASRGQSLGLEIFGLRLQSIAAPHIEESALSRMLLLPKILEKIKHAPLFGAGLGDTVSVYSPIFKAEVTTPHFDWGYLEIVAELGMVGLLAWAFMALLLVRSLLAHQAPKVAYAMLAALALTNLTSPALFHVFGVLLLVLLFAI